MARHSAARMQRPQPGAQRRSTADDPDVDNGDGPAPAQAFPVPQLLVGGPRDGQDVAVADHVQEIRYGAGGVYRRSSDGNFEWVSPA